MRTLARTLRQLAQACQITAWGAACLVIIAITPEDLQAALEDDDDEPTEPVVFDAPTLAEAQAEMRAAIVARAWAMRHLDGDEFDKAVTAAWLRGDS